MKENGAFLSLVMTKKLSLFCYSINKEEVMKEILKRIIFDQQEQHKSH